MIILCMLHSPGIYFACIESRVHVKCDWLCKSFSHSHRIWELNYDIRSAIAKVAASPDLPPEERARREHLVLKLLLMIFIDLWTCN